MAICESTSTNIASWTTVWATVRQDMFAKQQIKGCARAIIRSILSLSKMLYSQSFCMSSRSPLEDIQLHKGTNPKHLRNWMGTDELCHSAFIVPANCCTVVRRSHSCQATLLYPECTQLERHHLGTIVTIVVPFKYFTTMVQVTLYRHHNTSHHCGCAIF